MVVRPHLPVEIVSWRRTSLATAPILLIGRVLVLSDAYFSVISLSYLTNVGAPKGGKNVPFLLEFRTSQETYVHILYCTFGAVNLKARPFPVREKPQQERTVFGI